LTLNKQGRPRKAIGMNEISDNSIGRPQVHAKANKSPALRTELRETALDRWLLRISSLVFCLVVAFVILQVLIRYVTVHIGFSLPWTEESARYLLIFITFFGSAVALRKKEHITITTLVDRFPAKTKLIMDVLSSLLVSFFLIVAIIGCYSFTVKMMISPVGAIGWLKVGHLYGLMMVGLIMMLIYQVRWLICYATEVRLLFKGQQGEDAS
jgi:TRAP-type C4-dicarboxylate transport system permease small subunit